MTEWKFPTGTGGEYYYRICGQAEFHEVEASKEQITKAAAYFQKPGSKFPPGIHAFTGLVSGSVIIAIDNQDREAGKNSIVNVLGLPAPW